MRGRERNMTSKLERIAKLRELLLRMEGELGLEGLTRFERDVLYAIRSLNLEDGGVTSSQIRKHALVDKMSLPTFHRALRELILRGHIVNSEGRRGAYEVNLPLAKGPDP